MLNSFNLTAGSCWRVQDGAQPERGSLGQQNKGVNHELLFLYKLVIFLVVVEILKVVEQLVLISEKYMGYRAGFPWICNKYLSHLGFCFAVVVKASIQLRELVHRCYTLKTWKASI